MTKRSIKVRLEDGLDARPVALLVQEASKYESNIYIEVDQCQEHYGHDEPGTLRRRRAYSSCRGCR